MSAPVLDRLPSVAPVVHSVPGGVEHIWPSHRTFLPTPGTVFQTDRDGTEWEVYAEVFID